MKHLYEIKNYDSPHLFEQILFLSEEQIKSIERGLRWTINNVPSAVLIGGTAVVHYLNGGRDLTPDIDFLVSNIDEIKEKLNEQNIKYSELSSGNLDMLGINVSPFNTDFLAANQVNPTLNNLILKTPKTAKIGGYNVKIVNPELLTIMKLELGRDKDTDDAFNLITSGGVEREKYLEYANTLKNTLNDYESIINYADMIM